MRRPSAPVVFAFLVAGALAWLRRRPTATEPTAPTEVWEPLTDRA